MLISKDNLAVLHVASKDTTRPQLMRAHIDPATRTITATNGHAMLQSKLPEFLAEDFPLVDIDASWPDSAITVPVDQLQKAAKSIKGNKGNGTNLPILGNIAIMRDGKHIHAITTDLDTIQDLKTRDLDDHNHYPNFLQVLESYKKNDIAAEEILTLEELENVLKAAKAACCLRLRIKMSSSESPVHVEDADDVDKLSGILMPCRKE